jgi:hypothetical protein
VKGLDVLQLVQDVDWVVGSFIANGRGELLVYQMPPEFGEDELARTAARLSSIVRSAELCGVAVEQCDFSFSRYQLLVSRCAAGMLCVLVEAPVSRPALSMATRIALAELPSLLESLDPGVASSESALGARRGPGTARGHEGRSNHFGAVGRAGPSE